MFERLCLFLSESRGGCFLKWVYYFQFLIGKWWFLCRSREWAFIRINMVLLNIDRNQTTMAEELYILWLYWTNLRHWGYKCRALPNDMTTVIPTGFELATTRLQGGHHGASPRPRNKQSERLVLFLFTSILIRIITNTECKWLFM